MTRFGRQILHCITGSVRFPKKIQKYKIKFLKIQFYVTCTCSDVSSVSNKFCKSANCVISSNGAISCIPPCSHVAKCSPNYNRWPFDQQNCTLHIGTWVNSGDEIDFKAMKTTIADDEFSSQNMEWKMVRVTYKRNEGNFSGTGETYPSLTYSFSLKRHSAMHAAMLLVPAISM